jgi:hypothetical protein
MRYKGVWWCVDDEELTSSASTEPPLRAGEFRRQAATVASTREQNRVTTCGIRLPSGEEVVRGEKPGRRASS